MSSFIYVHRLFSTKAIVINTLCLFVACAASPTENHSFYQHPVLEFVTRSSQSGREGPPVDLIIGADGVVPTLFLHRSVSNPAP